MMNRRGFTLVDTVFGMGIAAILAVTLGMAASQHRQAMNKLADQRATMQHAQQILTAMQRGKSAAQAQAQAQIAAQADAQAKAQTKTQVADPSFGVAVQVLNHPEAPAKQIWVEVTVRYRTQTGRLVGLVPTQTMEKP